MFFACILTDSRDDHAVYTGKRSGENEMERRGRGRVCSLDIVERFYATFIIEREDFVIDPSRD